MQDNSIPADQPGPAYTPKPAAYLTPDVPVAVNHTHFRHVSDATTVICPSCAAHGLVSLPQFVTIGGQGFWQGINPGPPIYVEPVGHNLFETLVFSMVLPENQTKTDTWGPPWRRTGAHQPKTVDKVDNAWGGTFLPRRVRLYPVEHKGPCTRCGMPMEFGVKDIIYMSGPKWIGEAGTWVDPFCFYRKGRPVGAYGEYNDWTERMAKIFAGDPDKKGVPTAVKPIIVRQTQALGINVSWRLIFARTDQAKYFETGEVVVSPSGG
ncbi:MAG TPA: type I-E CRISPR-associated protein Cse1/CasA, partial [Myxococcota bacterium]|nr:type I-E CRISPR-associated protein Cse1/CasA [Myxococcota bacterium]